MKRVVITGLGLITSIGDNVEEVWNNLLSCKSGIRKITTFNTNDLPCKIAGFISNDNNSENFFKKINILKKKRLIEMTDLFNMD